MESKHVICSIVALGISAIGIVIAHQISPSDTMAEGGFDMTKLMSSLPIVYSGTTSLFFLIKSVVNKIKLKVNLEQINNDLEMLEQVEKRGKNK